MKTILVPIESHEAIRPTLETALMLARRFDSYVEGFALRFRVNEFVAVDMAGAIPLESLRDENLEEARRARQLFESFMQERAVPRAAVGDHPILLRLARRRAGRRRRGRQLWPGVRRDRDRPA